MKKHSTKFILLFMILLTCCAADYFTKQWAANALKDSKRISIVDGFVEMSYTENRGMVFGVLNARKSLSKHYLLTGLSLISIFFVICIIRQIREFSFFYHLPFFIILSGALGNLMDRIRVGHVVDFIHIHFRNFIDWPFLFNVADLFICIGGILLVVLIFTVLPIRQKQ
jgi:signal peptidase II